MDLRPDLLMDKRLVDRHVKRGLISQEKLKSHLDGLPDLDDHSEVVDIAMESVGVETVERKKTGEE